MNNQPPTLFQIFRIYLRLGCISFGGPVAHLGYFKEEFVNRRKWLSEERYAELLGLSQFVPGPSSSQLGFAIGWNQAGLAGAAIAWLGFTLPSALLMIGFAYGVFSASAAVQAIIPGLLAAAVAVVANAIVGLGHKLCPDAARVGIALGCALFVSLLPSTLGQIIALSIAAAIGILWLKPYSGSKPKSIDVASFSLPRWMTYTLLTGYAVLLLASLLVSSESEGSIFALHYRAGALVFGGGHVVLPLLNDSIVTGGIVGEQTFLAGYSAAQALPGPLFTFASYLGTIGSPMTPPWLGGLGALLAIFLPGMLLLVGILPFWERIRSREWARAAITGANAGVVGLLLSAFIDPVWSHGIGSWRDFGIATVAFLALYRFKAPAWLVVISCGFLSILLT